MVSRTGYSLYGFVTLISVAMLAIPCYGQSRKIKVADEMPEFALPDSNGGSFVYKHGSEKVLAVAFISANQRYSERAADEIIKIIGNLHDKAGPFDFVVVLNDPNALAYFSSMQKKPQDAFRILLDTKYELWGQLGIIATPTVLVVGKEDKVLWIKAGYGYDFEPELETALGRALGIISQEVSKTQVETLINRTVDARVKRHLSMAKMLEAKGRLESAVLEVQKAKQLDPNSTEIALRLGELYCRTGQAEQALEILSKPNAQSKLQKAEVSLVLGWANRQLGHLDVAAEHLLEATKLNPKSPRAFFELGKVYQEKGQYAQAAQAYRRALEILLEQKE